MKRLRSIVVAGLLTSPFTAILASQKAVVIVPVADLRSDQSLPPVGLSDDKQQTQLLFGEIVEVVKSSGDWVYVNAIEQPEFTTHQKWEGYPGWVLANSLSLKAPAIASKKKTPPNRQAILNTAKRWIGTPYVWGGLSSVDAGHNARLIGMDCSGVTHLSYRLNGLTIPRDSMEQYMKAEKIKRSELKPGDLVFSAKQENPKKITHVALYNGNGQLIEAPQTGIPVREISFKDKFGADFSTVESGDHVGERYIYFGRFIKD